jgi:HAD superfamily phosphoserine phosphatase-like hydrolase
MVLFARAFEGMPVDAFEQRAREFARSELPGMIRPRALERMTFHQRRGDRVLIVTASPTDWIAPWAASEGVTEVLGDPAEVSAGQVTGRLSATNCYGVEKLKRVLAVAGNRDAYSLFVYGDSRGDKELLEAADHAFYRRFE